MTANTGSELGMTGPATGMFRVALLLLVLFCPPAALGQPSEPRDADIDGGIGDTDREITHLYPNGDDESAAAGICGPLNICSDSDCSTAQKCAAGCFGSPTCASQCGGSRCNVGCNPGVCGSDCPQECNPVTCPQNVCSTACGDPTCKVACGGSPCNAGCPDRCDPALCAGNALCLPACGGDSCNVGCSPCEDGCPEECSPVVCAMNAICLPSCGGSQCNVGCSLGVCGADCPQECDPVLCPQNTVSCIWDLLNDFSDRLDLVNSRATDAKNASEEVVDRVRDGVAVLTGDLRTAIDDALADLKRIVARELSGAEYIAFTDGANSCSAATCEPFRKELLSLLLNFESTANGLFAMTGLSQLQLDFQRMRGIVDDLPGRILFPLYLVFKTDNGDLLGSISGLLADLNADLDPLQDVFNTDTSPTMPAGPGTPTCTAMTEDPLVFQIIIIRNAARAIALKIIAKIFDALGETSTNVDAGVHGYAHITYEDNFPKKFAAVLVAMSDSESYIAKTVKAKLEFCLKLQVIVEAEQSWLDLLDGQSQLLDALRGNADLNYDGEFNVKDYAVFQRKFGSAGATRP